MTTEHPVPAQRRSPEPESTTSTPAQRMIALGIVQADNPALRARARPFELPREAAEARETITRIRAAMDRVAAAHRFAKGMGMAAPQIGIDRAATVIRTGNGELVLLNPRIVDRSGEGETLFEGCLSFFDVRGEVERAACVTVEHRRLDGVVETTRFGGGLARHVQHEVDHLEGRLYTDRMPTGTDVIPLSEYQGTGRPWRDP
ncbi:peptide deformylase [Paractinoplanes lichenicola]|uniref:Peptide deformylase n=1 Tax=Paractinoplanes lichenicola TaxID=2802976 RepID=A0ABS1VJL6_9ACTN|nr:peptide deformylase [Actinoplanes lichenicola]MBL7253947.1 peptide deformylase [Actinoplanes lichenicola]